jgi:hypothetical protein
MYPIPYQQRIEYRLPAIRWSNQQWVVSRNTVASRGIIIEHLEIDPTQLPRPIYFPGQQVAFRDSHGKRHEGTIERVGCNGCAYQDPSQRDYWYQWTYLGTQSYTYTVRTSITECYQIFAEAILGVLSPHL